MSELNLVRLKIRGCSLKYLLSSIAMLLWDLDKFILSIYMIELGIFELLIEKMSHHQIDFSQICFKNSRKIFFILFWKHNIKY